MKEKIIGDVNARAGKENKLLNTIMRIKGEMARNNNREKMILSCVDNDLIITNTKFRHKYTDKSMSTKNLDL